MRLKRVKDVSWKVVDKEGVILHLKTGNYYSLNELGLKIWQLCDGKRSPEQIASSLARGSRADSQRLRRDAQKFIGSLRKEKLLEAVAP